MITVYTDGSCIPNPGQGSWAFTITDGSTKYSFGGYEFNTTNNRMEYMAFIEATKRLSTKDDVEVFSDSQLLVNTYNSWMDNWDEKKMLKKKNTDLIYKLMDIKKSLPKLRLSWVKGHAGIDGNEEVDQLCEFHLENNWVEINGLSYLKAKNNF